MTYNPDLDSASFCQHADRCGGCSYWRLDPLEQKKSKLAIFTNQINVSLAADNLEKNISDFVTPDFVSPIPFGKDRQRMDFQIRMNKAGFFQKSKEPSTGFPEIEDIQNCSQLSPSLQKLYSEIRPLLPIVEKASVRLRVSPYGHRGMWLDLENLKIKELLTEKVQLTNLMKSLNVLEIGQRRSTVINIDGQLLLDRDNHLKHALPWTRTWVRTSSGELSEIPLYSSVGDFSQPSDKCNQWISNQIGKFCEGSKKIFEFGCGNGNLSFPALSVARELVAFDREDRAIDHLTLTFDRLSQDNSKIQNHFKGKTLQSNAQWLNSKKSEILEKAFQSADTLLINPSREGAGSFLDNLNSSTIQKVVMMSCHVESFAKDFSRLLRLGYELKEWNLLDQFPYTPHLEILAKLEKPAY